MQVFIKKIYKSENNHKLHIDNLKLYIVIKKNISTLYLISKISLKLSIRYFKNKLKIINPSIFLSKIF